MTTFALPDAEALYATLLTQIRGQLSALEHCALVGIHSGGAWLAERLARDLGLADRLGYIDVSLHRDDYNVKGLPTSVKTTRLNFDVEGATILLIDDVLYTGRTTRAAINELFDFGRPRRILLAALVDRGGRQLPVAADFLAARIDLRDGQSLQLERADNGNFTFNLHHV